MKFNQEKFLEFGKTLSIPEQKKFIEKTKNFDSAVKINPDIFIEGLNMLFEEYPKFRECFEYD